ncbi:MAG: hypothetical protein AAGK32_03140, partial [Actinomycetota bacterium]
MDFAVIGMLIAFVGLGIASVFGWKYTADRGRKLERLALANDFAFSHDDLSGVTTFPFDLFEQGDGQMAHNVITGLTDDGMPVRVFDFTYFIEKSDF